VGQGFAEDAGGTRLRSDDPCQRNGCSHLELFSFNAHTMLSFSAFYYPHPLFQTNSCFSRQQNYFPYGCRVSISADASRASQCTRDISVGSPRPRRALSHPHHRRYARSTTPEDIYIKMRREAHCWMQIGRETCRRPTRLAILEIGQEAQGCLSL
jgi:hypothetical protein